MHFPVNTISAIAHSRWTGAILLHFSTRPVYYSLFLLQFFGPQIPAYLDFNPPSSSSLNFDVNLRRPNLELPSIHDAVATAARAHICAEDFDDLVYTEGVGRRFPYLCPGTGPTGLL